MADTPTFVRPRGVKIVEMCMWVDAHMPDVLEPNCPRATEDQLVKYLYFIVDSLAKKQKYFPRYSDYDDYALYCAGEYFVIFRNKLQRAGEISRGKEIVPVKSCKNYIVNTMYAYKVLFQRHTYDACIIPEMVSNSDLLADNFRENVRQQYLTSLDDMLPDILEELPTKIKKLLRKECPYKYDDVMLEKIYMSIMLTFIKNITLPNKLLNKIEIDSSINILNNQNKKIKYYNKYKEDEIVLWHLPEHMNDYIQIWYRKAKRIITDEIADQRSRMDLSDEVVDSIMSTAFTTYDMDREEY